MDDVSFFMRTQGADVNARDQAAGGTPLHLACTIGAAAQDIAIEMMRNRADVNIQDARGQTPLHR